MPDERRAFLRLGIASYQEKRGPIRNYSSELDKLKLNEDKAKLQEAYAPSGRPEARLLRSNDPGYSGDTDSIFDED